MMGIIKIQLAVEFIVFLIKVPPVIKMRIAIE